jgi:bifunctional NMN adenylyltransferase/nudix hydrolase
MKKLEDISTVGVIIARVQTPYLHAGHIALFDHVSNKHPNVIVFLGIPRIQNTKRNPLDFSTRKEMIQRYYPNLIILPLEDNRSDDKWSTNVDSNIRAIFPDKSVIIYGSRDSFIPHYHGKYVVEEFPIVGQHNATDIRITAAEQVIPSEDFRAGVIYGINKQRPVTYPTVDVVVANDNGQILLARKPAETLFRFVGGFVDRTDVDWEMAARRELYEETKLSALKMHYVCSQAVEDWRYAREESGIMTTLFLTYMWDQIGRPEASDDIAEVRWFNLTDLFDITTEPNQGSGHVPKVKFDFHLEDKIVPEHIELMQKFLKKAVSDKLIVKKEV